jgi:hypothetical protein
MVDAMQTANAGYSYAPARAVLMIATDAAKSFHRTELAMIRESDPYNTCRCKSNDQLWKGNDDGENSTQENQRLDGRVTLPVG